MERKQEILAAYDRFDRSEKGALLRRGRAYRQLTSRWRREAGGIAGLESGGVGALLPTDPRDRRIAQLEAEKAALAAELERARHLDEA